MMRRLLLLSLVACTLAPRPTQAADKTPGEPKALRRAGIESPAQLNARSAFRSKLDIPKGDTSGPAPGGVVLTIESLSTMLENMGYEPKSGQYNDGAKYLTISIPRNTWTFAIGLDLSPDKSQIWLSSYLAEVKEPEKVKAEQVFKLLEANNSIWPCYFVYYTSSKGLSIYRPLKNLDVKPVLMKNTLEAHMNAIETTAALWDVSKWTAAN
jgi:hypothetical protein